MLCLAYMIFAIQNIANQSIMEKRDRPIITQLLPAEDYRLAEFNLVSPLSHLKLSLSASVISPILFGEQFGYLHHHAVGQGLPLISGQPSLGDLRVKGFAHADFHGCPP